MASTATYEVAIQVDDRERLSTGSMTIVEPGWYYASFKLVERGPVGTYPLRVWLYGRGRELDRREFTYSVREATEEEQEEQEEQLPWHEKSFMGLPVWAWLELMYMAMIAR